MFVKVYSFDLFKFDDAVDEGNEVGNEAFVIVLKVVKLPLSYSVLLSDALNWKFFGL